MNKSLNGKGENILLKTPNATSRSPVALITGATGGIGGQLAQQFAAGGYELVLVGRNEERLRNLSAQMGAIYSVKTHAISQDLTQKDAVQNITLAVEQLGLQVDVLVNDAGFGVGAPFIQSDKDKQQDLVQVNIQALVDLCYAFAPGMVQREKGGILNVASVAAFMPGPYLASYYASKAFVKSFTESLHVELRSKGVAVTALCPGPTRTNFWSTAGAAHTLVAHLTARPESVARAGYRALRWNKTLCIPGIIPKLSVFITRLVPRSWMAHLTGFLQRTK